MQYKARDGMTLYGYLTTPAGQEAKGLPMVVLPHGGPWAATCGDTIPTRSGWPIEATAVLQPNFRASVGYGKDYLNAGDRQWAGAMHTDLLDAGTGP